MKEVTFAREYRHRLDDLRTAHYPPGTMTVSNEVADAAEKAGALESKPKEAKADGRRSDS